MPFPRPRGRFEVSGTIALIDYGAGNLHSVHNALKAAGAGNVIVTANAADVLAADRIVLPGVGAFAHCMTALSALPGMIDALNQATGTGTGQAARPFLGICVGMQLMATSGHEHGEHPGLGWCKGEVLLMTPTNPQIKIPHMGWNDVEPLSQHPLLEPGEAYFLHSYAYWGEDFLATTSLGAPLAAAIGRENRIGVQFHPEKSQAYGLDFLKRFLTWAP
jgi:imidazole glycerol-phosphate synthase subunit HisH